MEELEEMTDKDKEASNPDEDGMWSETFKSHSDSKPYGTEDLFCCIWTCCVVRCCPTAVGFSLQDLAQLVWTSPSREWSMCLGYLSMLRNWL